MAPETLAEAERLLLGGASRDAVCEALQVGRKALERAFKKAHGMPPDRWRRQVQGVEPRPSRPDVAFRLSPGDRAELARRAEAAGVSPSEFARSLVREGLARGR